VTIRESIQQMLDAHDDGWSLTQHVICMGLERITDNGVIESTAWIWAPSEQPAWMTTALLEEGIRQREDAEFE
jgi:hypothetical protein